MAGRQTLSLLDEHEVEPVDQRRDEQLLRIVALIVRDVNAKVADVRAVDVERLAVEELQKFEDARITEFVPVLARRAVLRRLEEAHDGRCR